MIDRLRRWWHRNDRAVWVAGRWHECPEKADHVPAWELLGIFTNEARARKRCVRMWDFVSGPIAVNEELPDTLTHETEIPNVTYPWLEVNR